MHSLLAVFIGGGVGASLRHLINLGAARLLGSGGGPYATLFINVAGSVLIGMLAVWFEGRLSGLPQVWRSLLVTGVLGGFTTFSAFSLETLLLIERGDWKGAMLYVFASVLLSIAGCAGGWWLARTF